MSSGRAVVAAFALGYGDNYGTWFAAGAFVALQLGEVLRWAGWDA